jgi:hypothetical protein
MESLITIALWVAVVGLIVFALAWFGPRPSQWRTHDGDPVEEGGSAEGSTKIGPEDGRDERG